MKNLYIFNQMKSIIVIIFLLMTLSFNALAQISGTVTNPLGFPISNQTIYILDTATGSQNFFDSTITSVNGTYSFSSLPNIGFKIFTYDCNQSEYSTYIFGNSGTVDFQICSNSGTNCTAAFSSIADTNNQNLIHFTDLSSGNPSLLVWHFGDGDTSHQQNPSHLYPNSGTYKVILEIGSAGCYDSVSTYIVINNNLPCNANFNYTVDTNNQNLIHFTNLSSGNPSLVVWHFGDGDTSHQLNPSHLYTNSGTYNVILEIASTSCYDTSKTNIVINNNISCNANFNYSVDTNNQNLIHFANQSTGNISHFYWQFGDGDTSTQMNPTHLYANPGTYSVLLTIFSASCNDTVSANIVISNINPCVANFNYTIDTNNQKLIHFSDQSTGNPISFLWDFGDGDTSTQQNPSHLYANSGTYNVLLRIYSTSCTDTVSTNIVISNNNTCNANFNYSIDTNNQKLIHFMDQSTGNPINFLWDFGDGDTSTQQNPSHLYANSGTYNVLLTIYSASCSDTVSTNIVISNNPPPCNANFSYTVDTNNQNLIHFMDQSTGNPTVFLWDFGDGNTSVQQNPSHLYANGGNYLVELKIFSISGIDTCFSSYQKNINISSSPTGNISGSVFLDTSYLSTGKVFLYKQNISNQQISLIDSTQIITDTSGISYFIFHNLPYGSYLLKAIPSLQLQNSIPCYETWSFNEFNWEMADIIQLQSTQTTALIVIRKKEVYSNPGSGKISGSIIDSTHNPISNAKIFLLNPDSLIVEMTRSNSLGNFEFNNLAFGDYLVYPEIASFYSLAYSLTLNSQQSHVNIPAFHIQNQSIITSNRSIDNEQTAEIFPNPVSSTLHIKLNNLQSEAIVKIIDVSGKQCLWKKIPEGINEYRIDLKTFPKGIYFIVYTSDKHAFTKKIIKQ